MIEQKEISLSAIFHVIWERGKRILIFTFVCAALSAIMTLFVKNRYESAAFLMMSPSKLGERIMERPVIPMRTYVTFMTNPTVLTEIIQKYNLKERPYKFRFPQDLYDRILVYYMDDTAMLVIRVQMEDAQMAADIANALADRGIKTVKKLIKDEQTESTGELKLQSNGILNQVEGYKTTYLESLKRNMKPLHMQVLSNLMTMYANDVLQKETLDATIIELIEKKSWFESEVFSATSDYKQKVQLRRALVTDPLLVEQIREQKGGPVNLDDLKNIVFFEETLDTYYNSLLMEYKSLLADIPSQTKKRDFLANRVEELKKEITKLQSDIFDMDVEELITKADLDRELEIYSGIYKEVGWAGATVASERQDLVVIDPAVPVEKKVYPRRSLMVGLTGISAFLLAFLYYLIVDLYGLVTLKTVRKEA